MSLTMTKKGYQSDFVYKGTCKNCGAEYEADPKDIKSSILDFNCDFCQGARTVRMRPTAKKEILLG